MKTPKIRSRDIAVTGVKVLRAAFPMKHAKHLGRLPQVRQKLNGDLDELAASIKSKGQQVSARAVALEPDEAARYLEAINRLWDTALTLEKFHPIHLDGDDVYLFIVFGHRRLRACELAGVETYLVDIYRGLQMEEAIPIQFVENYHKKVPIEQLVEAAWRFWRFRRNQNPTLEPASFAKEIGRRPEWVRQMLAVCSLPEVVQRRLGSDPGDASFTLLTEVARLVEAHRRYNKPLEEQEIVCLVDHLMVRRVSAKAFAKEVTRKIKAFEGEQGELFALEPVDERTVRRTAAAEMLGAFYRDLEYLRRIERLAKAGAFGELPVLASSTDGKPLDQGEYSVASPARAAALVVSHLQSLMPELVAYLELERDKQGVQALEEAMVAAGVERAVLEALLSKGS